MQINEKVKKYLELRFILLIFGVFTLIRAIVLLDYSDLTSNSFGKFISPILLILTSIFVLKVFKKQEK
jgi:branched-subunit amino acid permease